MRQTNKRITSWKISQCLPPEPLKISWFLCPITFISLMKPCKILLLYCEYFLSYRLPKYTGWVKIWIILRWRGSRTEGSFTAARCSCLKQSHPKGNWQKLNRKGEITRMRVWGCGSLLENGGSLTLSGRREESPGEGGFYPWVMGRWRVRWADRLVRWTLNMTVVVKKELSWRQSFQFYL